MAKDRKVTESPPVPTGKEAILAGLRRLNPRYPAGDLVVYVDAYLEYQEAQANITANGAICQHPRTGAPMENPYLKVRNAAGAVIGKHPRLHVGRLWETGSP